MPVLPTARATSLALAVLVAAFALSATVLFQAPRPGADLAPSGGSENLIQILQGDQSLLWTTLSGRVTSYVVQGWPSASGENELGGALMMERPANGTAGIIDFGEKPMTLRFEIAGYEAR